MTAVFLIIAASAMVYVALMIFHDMRRYDEIQRAVKSQPVITPKRAANGGSVYQVSRGQIS